MKPLKEQYLVKFYLSKVMLLQKITEVQTFYVLIQEFSYKTGFHFIAEYYSSMFQLPKYFLSFLSILGVF